MRKTKIYLDTMVWNKLCDEVADPEALVSALAAKGAELVIGTEAIYEMAKTFYGDSEEGRKRGQRLFEYLRHFVALNIRCMLMNPTLLIEEAHTATGEQKRATYFSR